MPHNPPPTVTLETGPVTCKGCRRVFHHLVIEEIKGVTQLRAGNVLVVRMDANCLHCGQAFHWNIQEKDAGKMAVMYGEVLRTIRPGYVPE